MEAPALASIHACARQRISQASMASLPSNFAAPPCNMLSYRCEQAATCPPFEDPGFLHATTWLQIPLQGCNAYAKLSPPSAWPGCSIPGKRPDALASTEPAIQTCIHTCVHSLVQWIQSLHMYACIACVRQVCMSIIVHFPHSFLA